MQLTLTLKMTTAQLKRQSLKRTTVLFRLSPGRSYSTYLGFLQFEMFTWRYNCIIMFKIDPLLCLLYSVGGHFIQISSFPSSKTPTFKTRLAAKPFFVKTSFNWMRTKNHFHINSFKLSLALKQRLAATSQRPNICYAGLAANTVFNIAGDKMLLRMRGMYVASSRWDFHWEWMECTKRNLITRIWTFYHSSSERACFNHLPCETYAKHSVWAKAFWPSIVVARTP